jgi:hypothetical protein
MICSVCGTSNDVGRKFCGECGAPLALGCSVCGSFNPPNVKFCGECGSTLPSGGTGTRAGSAEPEAETSTAERRLVSVMFADLVGFTSISEGRDPEEVREVLTRYFDLARDVIARYGGTVEKFIGDAVMAVWGAPVAHEDDAERAVRCSPRARG